MPYISLEVDDAHWYSQEPALRPMFHELSSDSKVRPVICQPRVIPQTNVLHTLFEVNPLAPASQNHVCLEFDALLHILLPFPCTDIDVKHLHLCKEPITDLRRNQPLPPYTDEHFQSCF